MFCVNSYIGHQELSKQVSEVNLTQPSPQELEDFQGERHFFRKQKWVCGRRGARPGAQGPRGKDGPLRDRVRKGSWRT